MVRFLPITRLLEEEWEPDPPAPVSPAYIAICPIPSTLPLRHLSTPTLIESHTMGYAETQEAQECIRAEMDFVET
tara:strand:+ start:186 stop:410 length:225 start_codon:yes stop_codon:yes gene_type:complete